MLKCVFFDRDGVLIKDYGYVHDPLKTKWLMGSIEAIKFLNKKKILIIIITNQSGIARGYYDENEFYKLTKWMLGQFKNNNIDILDIFHCPHGPDSSCDCRKPMPGMFLSAKNKYNIDMSNSWVIGDKITDIIAANNSGIFNTILVRSGHKTNESSSKVKFILDSIIDSKKVIIS